MTTPHLFSKKNLGALALTGVVAAAPAMVHATTFTWDDEAANGVLFASTGYANWTPDLVAADLADGSYNDFVISNTTRGEFYISGNTYLGSLSFSGSLPSAISILGNASATTSRYLRFYTPGATVISLADDYAGTVTVDAPGGYGYLAVGLNYTGMGTIHVGNSAATLDLSGAINNLATGSPGGVYGTGGMIKTGAGTLNLATTRDGQGNTFAGGLQILDGTVLIGKGIDLGATPDIATANAVVVDGGTLSFTGTSSTSNINRGFQIGDATINVVSGATFTIDGAITNLAGEAGSLTKTGAGTLTMGSSTNTFSGGLYILGGTVSTSSTLRLGATGTQGTTINGGTLRITATVYSDTPRYYYLGENGGGIEVTGSNHFRILRGVADVAGQHGVLIKTGTGIFSLPSSNSYTGGTIVQAGTLRLVGGNTATLGGASSIAGLTLYGTFSGAGTVYGDSYVLGGSTLDIAVYSTGYDSSLTSAATSAGIGTLTFTGNLDISDAALLNIPTFNFDLATTGASDQIVLTSGALTLGEGFLGISAFSFTAQEGFGTGTYTLISTSTTESLVGSLLASDTTGVVGGYEVILKAEGGSLFLEVGSAIPEPATWAAIFGGLALGTALLRRRARHA